MTARIQSPMHCVHCNTTETPLWRAGPAGPKTLCNACGVRWKKTGSVIPRTKRPSHTAPSNSNNNNPTSNNNGNLTTKGHSSNSTGNNSNATASGSTQHLRKRARTSSGSGSNAQVGNASQDRSGQWGSRPNSSHRHDQANERSEPKPMDAAARVAAALLPAPRPISVFRVSDVQRSRYDSVFTGLMAVNRRQRDPEESRSMRSRTQTAKASAYFSDLPSNSGNASNARNSKNGNVNGVINITPSNEEVITPSPSPPPIDISLAQSSVYVTEVLAPSPSPSPPPMPKVKRLAAGGSFRLVVTTAAEERKLQSI